MYGRAVYVTMISIEVLNKLEIINNNIFQTRIFL